MASTYDLTGAGAAPADSQWQSHTPEWQLLTRTVNFAKAKNGTTNMAATETADLINIPAGFLVEEVFYKIVTASTTSSSTFGLGDSTDSSYFMPNTQSATQTAGTIVKVPSVATASKFKGSNATAATLMDLSSKLYSTADKFVLLIGGTAPLDGVIKVYVRGVVLV